MIIRNADVLHVNRVERMVDVRTESGKITEVGPSLKAMHNEHTIDAAESYLLPGLIDLHTHGLRDCNAQEDALVDFSRYQFSEGVTGCLPTLQGTPEENAQTMRRGLQTTKHFSEAPNIWGFRPEIMYVAKTGAGSQKSLVPITDDTTQLLWEASEGTIRVWDVAPELKNAVPFVSWARHNGVVTSLAHSSATIDQARAAVDAGLRLVTHFYDTFDLPNMVDPGVYPEGLVDYLLTDDRVALEIIPDGVHAHPLLVEKALRCKGKERVAFITDSVKGAGNPPGVYSGLFDGVEVMVTKDRGMRRTTDDCLSGSALTHISSLRNAVHMFGMSVADASIMCSGTPAAVLGLTTKGYIAVGMDADLIVVDRDLNLRTTICGGNIVYDQR